MFIERVTGFHLRFYGVSFTLLRGFDYILRSQIAKTLGTYSQGFSSKVVKTLSSYYA